MPLVFRRNIFKVITESLEHRAGVLTKRSTVSFGFDPAPTVEQMRDMRNQMGKFGGIIGFRIRRTQTIRSLRVAGAECPRDAAHAKRIQQAFGAAPGEKWVGFRIGANPSLLGPSFETELRIAFNPRSAGLFQLVPIVVAFGDQDLRRHAMIGVTVLKTGRPFADTTVELVDERPS